MKQFFNIFAFEFSAYYKQKSFLITTIIFVVVIAGVLFFPRVSGLFEDVFSSDTATGAEQVSEYLLVDSSDADRQKTKEMIATALPNVNFTEKQLDEQQINELVNAGDYDGALVITSPTDYSIIVPTLELTDSTAYVIEEVLTQRLRIQMLEQDGLSAEQAEVALNATVNGEVVATGNDQTQNFFYSYILMFILYILVLTYGSVIAVSVATEKSSRAMEMLITSADTKNLMFGKILGTSAACIGQFCIIVLSAFAFYQINIDYHSNPFITSIFAMPLDIVLYALLFCLLGFLIYAMMFGALGSLVTKTEEVNSVLTPAMLPFIGTFLLVNFSMTGVVGGGVNGILIKVLSFIPFSSPFAMFVRISMGEVTAVEIAISIALLLVAVFLMGILTAKIYRVGVLLYGTPLKITALVKAIKNA